MFSREFRDSDGPWCPTRRFSVRRCRIARAVLIVQHDLKGASVSVESGRPEFELAEGTASIHDVADVMRGPMATTGGSKQACSRSAGLPGSPSGRRPKRRASITRPRRHHDLLQGPVLAERVPPPEQMVGPDQTLLGHGSDWVELEYQHEGVAWRQTHRVVAGIEEYRVLVTAQGPAEHFPLADVAARQVAESLQRFRTEESE